MHIDVILYLCVHACVCVCVSVCVCMLVCCGTEHMPVDSRGGCWVFSSNLLALFLFVMALFSPYSFTNSYMCIKNVFWSYSPLSSLTSFLNLFPTKPLPIFTSHTCACVCASIHVCISSSSPSKLHLDLETRTLIGLELTNWEGVAGSKPSSLCLPAHLEVLTSAPSF